MEILSINIESPIGKGVLAVVETAENRESRFRPQGNGSSPANWRRVIERRRVKERENIKEYGEAGKREEQGGSWGRGEREIEIMEGGWKK